MNYRRWLPRISLRILLLLVAVLCVCLAFWRPAERDISVRRAIIDYLQRPAPSSRSFAVLTIENDFPTGPMRASTRDLLHRAIEEVTTGNEQRRREDLEMLDQLAELGWPQIQGLPYVHFSDGTGETESFGWLLVQDDGSQCLLDWSLCSTPVSSPQTVSPTTNDDVSFNEDVQRYLKRIHHLPNFRVALSDDAAYWDLQSDENGFPGSELLWWNLAYAAAENDLEDTTLMLMERINKTQGGLVGLRNAFVQERLQDEIDRLTSSNVVNNDDDWREFLANCRQLRDRLPESDVAGELSSLIEPLEADLAKQRPFLDKRPKDLTDDEIVELLIYRFRDLSAGHTASAYSTGTWSRSDPVIFSTLWAPLLPTEADMLVALGDDALEQLVEAVQDTTPTRSTSSWFGPGRHTFLMRRQDMALMCLQRITGCTFYQITGERAILSQESAERRASVIAHVHKWWQNSKGKSQAEMIRNYLATVDQNLVMNDAHSKWQLDSARDQALMTLGYLEGPKNVLNQLKPPSTYSPLTSRALLAETSPAVAALRRFKAGKPLSDDLEYLFKYGDQSVYQEIAEIMEPIATREKDSDEEMMPLFGASFVVTPDTWFHKEHVGWASTYGQNWAIPVLAAMLQRTTAIDDEELEDLSIADLAIVEFQKLTGKDFGYERDSDAETRGRAIRAARDWWLREGKAVLGDKIARNHPPALSPGDMFLRHPQIVELAKKISSSDKTVRRETILKLGSVHSHITQQALLDALADEEDANIKMIILEMLGQHPRLWFLAALTGELTDKRNDPRVRVVAGSIIKQLLEDKIYGIITIRLETRDRALSAARELAKDKQAPLEVRKSAIEILSAWDSFVDLELLKSFAH